jgi:hypothetical protein
MERRPLLVDCIAQPLYTLYTDRNLVAWNDFIIHLPNDPSTLNPVSPSQVSMNEQPTTLPLVFLLVDKLFQVEDFSETKGKCGIKSLTSQSSK